MLEKIKSNYIYKIVVKYIDECKVLKIINYNKKLQKRTNISITDYIKISEIEIELIFEGYNYLEQANFISPKFLSSQNSDFVHFYLNNKLEEEKIPYNYLKEKINKIKIIMEYNIKSFANLFNECKYIKEIKFNKFHRNNIIDMQYMFNSCSSLIILLICNICLTVVLH